MGCAIGKGVISGSESEKGKWEPRKNGNTRTLSIRSRTRVTKTETGVVDENADANRTAEDAVQVVQKDRRIRRNKKEGESEDQNGSRRHRRHSESVSGQLKSDKRMSRRKRRSGSKHDLRIGSFPRGVYGEQVAAGWPPWLSSVAGEAINGWIPRRADAFEKIDKIGQGTYSNVYKARDILSGKIVAMKKVRFDNMEPESVKFMAREINILRRLDHPNIVKLEGLVTSRMSCSLYLVFEYMEHDLAGLIASPSIKFSIPQVKCYMTQLLSGLEHCHNRQVLHRDVKGSNLLLDNSGMLKIADFGLASTFDPNHKHPMTSRVVTLWYRSPELLMGATNYGVGVDLWSAGCILAELLHGKPIMPGRTEVEQLHKIFKLCGTPEVDYWKKYKLPHATLFKPQQQYKRCIVETFKNFPASSFSLIDTLVAIDPTTRQTATAALGSEFFTTEPYACHPSSLPQYPPSKELDVKLRDEEARRAAGGKGMAITASKKTHSMRDRTSKAFPAPEANAELQVNIDRRRAMANVNAKSKSEKYPPSHKDGTLGFTLGMPGFLPPENSFSAVFSNTKEPPLSTWSGPLANNSDHLRRKKQTTQFTGHSSSQKR